MNPITSRGFTAVLHNRNFLFLWLAQILSTIALNGAFFLQLVLIEEITGSSAHLAAVILAFSLPAVLLSAAAGLLVDRVSKKYILVGSNAFRILTGAALAALASFLSTHDLNETIFLLVIYFLVFITSAIGQFFGPAEGAVIPLIVSKENLLTANSLFTLTFNAAQVVGIVLLAPLGIKTIGIAASLWVAVALYIISTILVALIPRDPPARARVIDGITAMPGAWTEIRDGWHFAMTHRPILIGLLQIALVSALMMIMVMLAPGYAARVLGLQAEDATVVFWPAGVGMFLASILIGRFGHHLSRELLGGIGMMGLAFAMAGLAWAGGGGGARDIPLFRGHPELTITTTVWVMIFSLGVGLALATINIPAQTLVQENSTDAVRGRVFAVQFTLSNALAIPPMLFVANLADIFGIPRITLALASFIALLAIMNVAWALSKDRRARRALASHSSEESFQPSDSS